MDGEEVITTSVLVGAEEHRERLERLLARRRDLLGEGDMDVAGNDTKPKTDNMKDKDFIKPEDKANDSEDNFFDGE